MLVIFLNHRMEGLGIIVVMAFLILIIAILTYTSCSTEGFFVAKSIGERCSRSTECATGNCDYNLKVCADQLTLPDAAITGYEKCISGNYCCNSKCRNDNSLSCSNGSYETSKPELCPGYISGSVANNASTSGSSTSSRSSTSSVPPVGNIFSLWRPRTTTLPPASISGAVPYQDPILQKASTAMVISLKADMDAFYNNQIQSLSSTDPRVTLALSQFRGDYQRIKDEVNMPTPSLTIVDLETILDNLRFLQRTVESGTVPKTTPDQPSYSAAPSDQPITLSQLRLLIQKVAVEIVRLQASGTDDPILQARINVFTKIQTSITDIYTKVTNGSMKESEIPIKVSDYNKFLPAIGNSSAGISGLLSKMGYPSLSSLFNAYDTGDISGSQIAANLFETYAESLLNGLSYNVGFSYTSPNEVAARQAEAAIVSNPNSTFATVFPGSQGMLDTNHPMTLDGARGGFDAYTRTLDMQQFQGDTASVSPSQAAGFDWQKRAEDIIANITKMGLDPADFGYQPDVQANSQVGDFSWRGYAKMICTRLATHSDSAMPEQVGCPPVSWRGWRT